MLFFFFFNKDVEFRGLCCFVSLDSRRVLAVLLNSLSKGAGLGICQRATFRVVCRLGVGRVTVVAQDLAAARGKAEV